VLVAAVAGVDDGGGKFPGQEVGGAAVRVAQHEHVRAHGQDVLRRVQQGFPLGQGRGGGGEGEGIGGKALGGDLEGHPGPGGRLDEHQHHGDSPERRDLLDAPLADGLELPAEVQDGLDLLSGHSFQTQQVVHARGHRVPSRR
jgi:hypothetical protein